MAHSAQDGIGIHQTAHRIDAHCRVIVVIGVKFGVTGRPPLFETAAQIGGRLCQTGKSLGLQQRIGDKDTRAQIMTALHDILRKRYDLCEIGIFGRNDAVADLALLARLCRDFQPDEGRVIFQIFTAGGVIAVALQKGSQIHQNSRLQQIRGLDARVQTKR